MRLKFHKWTGTGNDFLIFDGRTTDQRDRLKEVFYPHSRADWAKRLCHRHFGPGADGFLVVEAPQNPKADYAWDFYNSDGSPAEMCGNAARCVGKWLLLDENREMVKIETTAGLIEITPDPKDKQQVSVDMRPIESFAPEQVLKWEAEELTFDVVNTGVPHVVLSAQDISPIEYVKLKPLAAYLRNHKAFEDQGTNVTFCHALSEDHIKAVSFERGVEDFTLACGTGAVAAAESHRQRLIRQNKNGPTTLWVDLPGGQLRVEFLETGPKMCGPAHHIGVIEANINEIRLANPETN